MITPETATGALAADNAAAKSVFLRHQIDFCCHGSQSLAEACEGLGLQPDDIIAEIAEFSEEKSDDRTEWSDKSNSEITDHIVSHYHDTIRRDLPGIIDGAMRVENVHKHHASCPTGLAAHLRKMSEDVLQHMQKEELLLFPMLRAGKSGQTVRMPILVMETDHTHHAVDLQQTRALTGDLTLPTDACGTWTTLYNALEGFERDLIEHIHLENNILFPRALAS